MMVDEEEKNIHREIIQLLYDFQLGELVLKLFLWKHDPEIT